MIRAYGYVSRPELPSLLTGGKPVHFDRVEWQTIPDPATAAAALQRREIDWLEQPLVDLLPTLNAFDVAVTDFFEDGVYRTPAWHMLGTCRMGADPASSTVDRWHQAWEVPNLYLCDGSSCPTGGVVNPTSTVTALALRCARHIAENFAELRRPQAASPAR